MRYSSNTKILACVLATVVAFSVRADELVEKGREIFNKNQRAIVTVEVVQKVSATSGRSNAPREAKTDLSGTVVDPSGLTVIALSAADPSELYRRLSEEYKTEIEISEIKLLLDDGTELPAEIVLRDKDLDLAFIRPKNKLTTPMTAIDLHKSSIAQVLDPLISLNRLKRGAGRAFSASVERVSAVVQKPRTFYVPETGVSETSLGCPAFSLDGSLVGIFVMRAVNAQGAANWRDCLTGIILPADDILKGAVQAPQAKGDSETPDSTKTPAEPAKTDAPKEPAK
ncbi:MAG TPA: serine protease [Verrucomicrobiae bacterium]|jgi:S1-C subfamily serine protease|nr:serine protease [Verrucomicrobiae bacterium]